MHRDGTYSIASDKLVWVSTPSQARFGDHVKYDKFIVWKPQGKRLVVHELKGHAVQHTTGNAKDGLDSELL